MSANTLMVEDLKIQFELDEGTLKAVDGISFKLEKGKTLGLVGESGCGKSLTSKAIMGIEPKNAKVTGSIIYKDEEGTEKDVAKMKKNGEEIRSLRGQQISMIFQEPMTAFSPLYTIGNQISENIENHIVKDKKEARKKSIEIMEKVGIASAETRFDQYPTQFSGGMRQRAMIAMALSCNPDVLIADEPTTALDVTIQAQVLHLMKDLQKDLGTSVLFITHDLGVVAKTCDNVAVMYLGKIVESGTVREIFKNPKHPYTIGLINSLPKMGQSNKRLEPIEGSVPTPINLPNICGFYDRCTKAIKGLCDNKPCEMANISETHKVSCFLYNDNKEEK